MDFMQIKLVVRMDGIEFRAAFRPVGPFDDANQQMDQLWKCKEGMNSEKKGEK